MAKETQIQIRVTKEEKRLITSIATLKHMTISEYLLYSALPK